MKLFVFATLVAAASAGRLEHLERSYLPPDSNVQSGHSFGSGNGRFGVSGHSSNGFGSNGGSNGFGSNGSSNKFGANGRSSFDQGTSHGSNGFGSFAGSSSNGLGRNAAFESASSNQYLPPNHGPSGSSNSHVSQFGSHSGSSSQGSVSFGSQRFGSQPQFGAASRQYLAPKYSSSQQTPQQPFDDQSGYIY